MIWVKLDKQHTYDARYVGATYDVRCFGAASAYCSVRCVRVAFGAYDVGCVRVSAYCSSRVIYDARCVGAGYCAYDMRYVYCSSVSRNSSCKVLSNVGKYESIDY